MSALLPFLALDQTCEQVQGWVTKQLTEAGLRVKQTFDLHIARLAHPECPCPHHGTDECDCQMVVLLVYRKHEAPATLVIHGQDERTWLSMESATGKQANHQLEAVIRRALTAYLPTMPSPLEVAHEARPTV